jgi:hypothetical protein
VMGEGGKKPKLIVVPGNHDYRPFGFLPFLLSTRFQVYFGPWNDNRDPVKLRHRLARYGAIARLALTKRFDNRPWDAEPKVYPLCIAGPGCVIVGYDSNWTRLLATGRVRPSKIRDT